MTSILNDIRQDQSSLGGSKSSSLSHENNPTGKGVEVYTLIEHLKETKVDIEGEKQEIKCLTSNHIWGLCPQLGVWLREVFPILIWISLRPVLPLSLLKWTKVYIIKYFDKNGLYLVYFFQI